MIVCVKCRWRFRGYVAACMVLWLGMCRLRMAIGDKRSGGHLEQRAVADDPNPLMMLASQIDEAVVESVTMVLI